MTLADLAYGDQVALIALVELLATADGVSDEAEADIERLADSLGDETYRELVDEAERRFPTIPALRAHLAGISDPAVREFVYEAALNEASAAPSPAGEHRAAELLQWLREQWGICEEEDT